MTPFRHPPASLKGANRLSHEIAVVVFDSLLP